MTKRETLSVVLSFRNEQEVISELVTRLNKVLATLVQDYEIIFVNDASTDRSLEILCQYAERDSHIRIINMSRTFGVSQCVLAGMKVAGGDAVIYMDADLQDPPELIVEMVAKWQEGADVVHTTRIDRAGESAFKLWVTKWAYKVLRASFDEIDLPIDTGDFKLLSKRVVAELLQLKEKDPFLRGLVTWVGFKQVAVTYRREKRFAGSTHQPLFSKGPIRAFLGALISFSAIPLYLSLLIGFLVSLGALIYILIVVAMKITGYTVPGWSAIMVTMLFLGGIQLFVLGILGLYLGRVHDEVRNRPNYIVKNTVGLDDK